ncbi:hypothetical protein B9Z19DRAFT_1088694 [Tuber borchii]|uniref:Secreted protein n=1 Tax=Tuber borchii TaxID=42251 RepID=A0A2T6ZL89_TUBBO|nr:hypothetical protein B9Z19DRAFT_1088694 [Tuber borchii]
MGWMGSFCLVAFAFFLSFLLSPCFVYSNSSADGIQVSLAVFLLIGLYRTGTSTCKLSTAGRRRAASEKKRKKKKRCRGIPTRARR